MSENVVARFAAPILNVGREGRVWQGERSCGIELPLVDRSGRWLRGQQLDQFLAVALWDTEKVGDHHYGERLENSWMNSHRPFATKSSKYRSAARHMEFLRLP